MITKKSLSALNLLAISSSIVYQQQMEKIEHFEDKKEPRKINDEEKYRIKQARLESKQNSIAKANGLKEYSINGTIILAINEKNAFKKYLKSNKTNNV